MLMLVAAILIAELISELLVPAPAITCRTPSFSGERGDPPELEPERA